MATDVASLLFGVFADERGSAGQADLLAGLRLRQQRIPAHHPSKLHPHLRGGAPEMLSGFSGDFLLSFPFHPHPHLPHKPMFLRVPQESFLPLKPF